MGRDEVRQKYEQDKYLDGAEYMVKVLRDAGQQYIRLGMNLHNILGKDAVYTDMDGVTYKVSGVNQLTKKEREALGENAPDEDSMGLKELLDNKKFKGKPFREAGRNLDAHFRVFCLANGITDEEMLSLADPNPPKAVVDRIETMREPFVNMILNHDTEMMAFMYANFVQNAMEKADKFADMVDNPQGIIDNKNNMILYANVQSYIAQTLDLGGNPESEETIELVQSIDKKLRQRGIEYNFRQFENYIAPLANMFQTSMNDMNMTDEQIAERKQDMLNPVDEYESGNIFKGMARAVYRVNAIANLAYRPYNEQRKALGTVEKAVAEKDYDPLDFANYDLQGREVTLKEFEDNVQKNRFQEIAVKNLMKTPADLRDRMQNHVRRTLGFKRKNTEKYQNVVDSLSVIATLQHQLQNENADPELFVLRENKLKQEYENLKTAAQRYLTDRDPGSTDGKERYRMVLEAEDLAKNVLNANAKKVQAKHNETMKVNFKQLLPEKKEFKNPKAAEQPKGAEQQKDKEEKSNKSAVINKK